MEAVANKDPLIKKAVVRLMELSADERTRLLYEAREKERMDNESREEWARDTGRAEGKAEGEKAEREKWLGVVSEKDTALAEQATALAEKDTALAEKDTALAEQALLIAELRARLDEDK